MSGLENPDFVWQIALKAEAPQSTRLPGVGARHPRLGRASGTLPPCVRGVPGSPLLMASGSARGRVQRPGCGVSPRRRCRGAWPALCCCAGTEFCAGRRRDVVPPRGSLEKGREAGRRKQRLSQLSAPRGWELPLCLADAHPQIWRQRSGVLPCPRSPAASARTGTGCAPRSSPRRIVRTTAGGSGARIGEEQTWRAGNLPAGHRDTAAKPEQSLGEDPEGPPLEPRST